MRGALGAAAAALAAVGFTITGSELWLFAKARLATVLIDRALTAHFSDGAAHRPWPWADFTPIARLEVPRLGVRRSVLGGATGAVLAFGLGHIDGTTEPGRHGHAAIAGHRDGSAAFLEKITPGDEILLTARGAVRRCKVRGTSVVAQDAPGVLDDTGGDRLTLVTCWPFGGLTGSPWRYVVWGECESEPPAGVPGPVRVLTGTRGVP